MLGGGLTGVATSSRRSGIGLAELIELLERAEVHGHGGAHFPTATKLAAVAAQRRRPAVVVNGTEGEPLSRKDRLLLGRHPDAVLDGAFAVAQALSAEALVIAVDSRRVRTIDAVEIALERRQSAGGRRFSAEVVGIAPGYVSGQETALVAALSGREAKPRVAPPYVFEKGLHGRPTLVSNAETFAQIARVLDGSYDASRYVTVSGAVARTTVVQVRPETTVAAALEAVGGPTEPVSGVLLGGYGGTWAGVPEAFALTLDEVALRARGLTLGAGIVFALGQSQCPVAEVARVTRWMAGQSAGQCGPCVYGLDAIAGALEDLCFDGEIGAYDHVRRWCEQVNRRGACAHPDGVARYVTSALSVFAAEFEDHAAHGPCDRCAAGLAVPV